MVSHPQLNGVLDKKVQVQISDNTPLALSYILRYLCESLNGFEVKPGQHTGALPEETIQNATQVSARLKIMRKRN
jgi:hypothetical protein